MRECNRTVTLHSCPRLERAGQISRRVERKDPGRNPGGVALEEMGAQNPRVSFNDIHTLVSLGFNHRGLWEVSMKYK